MKTITEKKVNGNNTAKYGNGMIIKLSQWNSVYWM